MEVISVTKWYYQAEDQMGQGSCVMEYIGEYSSISPLSSILDNDLVITFPSVLSYQVLSCDRPESLIVALGLGEMDDQKMAESLCV